MCALGLDPDRLSRIGFPSDPLAGEISIDARLLWNSKLRPDAKDENSARPLPAVRPVSPNVRVSLPSTVTGEVCAKTAVANAIEILSSRSWKQKRGRSI